MSKKIISFSYVYVGGIFSPVIEIKLSHKNIISRPFDALVDSGSDKSLFPAQIGEKLGIEFDKHNPKIIYGIGGVQVKAFPKRIKLHMFKFSFDTEIDFSYEHDIPLLGRDGFFNLFKSIRFRERDKFLDIEF